MAAPTNAAKREESSCQHGAVHTWHVTGGVGFDQMISNFDGNWLHQNDWSYNCIAQALCDGIVEAVKID
jgi:hypothetical protein